MIPQGGLPSILGKKFSVRPSPKPKPGVVQIPCTGCGTILFEGKRKKIKFVKIVCPHCKRGNIMPKNVQEVPKKRKELRMSLKEQLEKGVYAIDVEKGDKQKHCPINTHVRVNGEEWGNIVQIKSLGVPPNEEDRLQVGFRISLFGPADEGVPVDLKKALKDGSELEIEIEEELKDTGDGPGKDHVTFIADVVKIKDDVKPGQVVDRYATLSIIGFREALDFEPPEVTLPKKPFAG